jgi:hypothetical protein
MINLYGLPGDCNNIYFTKLTTLVNGNNGISFQQQFPNIPLLLLRPKCKAFFSCPHPGFYRGDFFKGSKV